MHGDYTVIANLALNWPPIGGIMVGVGAAAGLTIFLVRRRRAARAKRQRRKKLPGRNTELRFGHSTISTTLDTYSHVAPGLQQAAAVDFDDILNKHSALYTQLGEILQN
jgi:hypothetical protein